MAEVVRRNGTECRMLVHKIVSSAQANGAHSADANRRPCDVSQVPFSGPSAVVFSATRPADPEQRRGLPAHRL